MKTIFGAIAVIALLNLSTEAKADFTGMTAQCCAIR